MRRPQHPIDQALHLRQWALRLLVGSRPPAPPQDLADDVDAWRLFLRVERCAHPISQRLDDAEERLSPRTLADLRRRAERETRLGLMARAQLEEIGQVADSLNVPVAVLKGGLWAARGSPIHLGDIDLLVPPEHADHLADALERRGYRRAGWSSPRHLEALTRPGELRLEIHVTLERDGSPAPASLWDEIVPLDAPRGLGRLSPACHLENLLTHIGVDHPSRRGRLRDLLLLAEALAETRARERGTSGPRRVVPKTEAAEALHDGLREGRDGGHLLRGTGRAARPDRSGTQPLGTREGLLRMAAALDEEGEGEDLFARTALANYAFLALLGPLGLPHSLSETVLKWTFALLEGRAERETAWADGLAVSKTPSPYRPLARMERALPPLGRGARLALRLGRLAAALAIAAPLAAAISREIQRR